jgi:hypothetical protein
MTQERRSAIFKTKFLWGWVTLVMITSGCGSRQNTPFTRPVSVRDVFDGPARFAGQVIMVDG